ncbi:MAG: hypothetical protein Q4B40_05815 [Clostridia bacterium]|nr:hypothetical protein [Clostridia bacterium]
MKCEFDNVLSRVAVSIARTLAFLPQEIKQACEEIRLRMGLPVCLTVDGRVMFVTADSNISSILPKNPIVADKNDINQTVAMLCNNSVYLHENEIKQGFISVAGGCRAGVCGSFNADGMLVSINSINIRIARQILGCAKDLLPFADSGLLIAGPPASGKTTLLRDIIRLLSSGEKGKYYRVSVIDSRCEISGGGVFDLSVNTDILYTENKAVGAQIALRTLSPNIIAFDEIGTDAELLQVSDCFNAGVGIITTAHCSTYTDLMQRKIIKGIIKSGVISYNALLGEKIGCDPEIIDVSRLICNVDN